MQVFCVVLYKNHFRLKVVFFFVEGFLLEKLFNTPQTGGCGKSETVQHDYLKRPIAYALPSILYYLVRMSQC